MNHPLPAALLDSLQSLPGFDRPAFEQVHYSRELLTSVRFNPFKQGNDIQPNAIPVSLAGIIGERVPWCQYGYYLKERPSFTLDPLFHAGAYYVQEASSMFIEQVLKETAGLSRPVKVLDLCAAPGGKSTLADSLISPESLLVSNEVIKTRVNTLADNITRWGAANVVVTNNDPKDFARLTGFFEVMIIDAPCSGSGLFRKDPEAIGEWSPENVIHCNLRQQRILADALPALRKDGILIYSTCSYSVEEDEKICDWIMDNFPMENIPVAIKEDWGIVPSFSSKHRTAGYRFYPDKLRGEGFFISCFRKQEGEAFVPAGKNKTEKTDPGAEEIIRPLIRQPESFFVMKLKEEYLILPKALENNIRQLRAALYIKQAGVKAGRIAGNILIPDHSLALSILLKNDTPSVELNKTQAIKYLRKEEIAIDTGLKGWSVARYAGYNLGWIKILPNRINNYFPKEWRILQQAG